MKEFNYKEFYLWHTLRITEVVVISSSLNKWRICKSFRQVDIKMNPPEKQAILANSHRKR